MRNILLTAAFVALSVPAAHAEDWYIGHMGSEPCVAVSDIGDNFERLYYGAGTMTTPMDVASSFQRLGATIKPFPLKQKGVFAFYTITKKATYTMVFFNDRYLCLAFMEEIGQ